MPKAVITLFIIFFIAGCSSQTATQPLIFSQNNMRLASPVFTHNGNIPSKYTCDGEDISPPLQISQVPEKTKSLVLIVDDPDAPVGDWVHWIVWNIPPGTSSIPENSKPEGIEGMTDFSRTGWGGPCPPNGEHRYFFKLYALDDATLSLDPSAKKKDIEVAMKGHIIEKAELVGLYNRNN